MAKKGRIVLNCVGPYRYIGSRLVLVSCCISCILCNVFRFHGEAVVNACVKNGTNHLDISGEPQVR